MKRQVFVAYTTLGLCFALMPVPSLAYETVREALPSCELSLGPQEQQQGHFIGVGFCMGLAQGVGNVLSLNCLNGNRPAADTWGHTTGAKVQVFVNWARANPQDWEAPPSAGMMLAFVDKFPCADIQP